MEAAWPLPACTSEWVRRPLLQSLQTRPPLVGPAAQSQEAGFGRDSALPGQSPRESAGLLGFKGEAFSSSAPSPCSPLLRRLRLLLLRLRPSFPLPPLRLPFPPPPAPPPPLRLLRLLRPLRLRLLPSTGSEKKRPRRRGAGLPAFERPAS